MNEILFKYISYPIYHKYHTIARYIVWLIYRKQITNNTVTNIGKYTFIKF